MKKVLPFLLILTLLFTAGLPPANAGASDKSQVTVTVDGAAYTTHVGDVIRYTYYLDLSGVDAGEGSKPGRVTEFEGTVYYNADSLKLMTELEDENGGYPSLPNLTGGSIFLSDDAENALKYNGIFLKGYSFDQKKIFLQLDFLITGDKDLYISHLLENLGSGEVRMIYSGVVSVKPKTDYKVEIGCTHGLYLIGDTDLDDDVVIIDASFIQLWLSEMKELSLQMLINSDFNRDGSIDITDVTAIQRMIAGLDYQVFG